MVSGRVRILGSRTLAQRFPEAKEGVLAEHVDKPEGMEIAQHRALATVAGGGKEAEHGKRVCVLESVIGWGRDALVAVEVYFVGRRTRRGRRVPKGLLATRSPF